LRRCKNRSIKSDQWVDLTSQQPYLLKEALIFTQRARCADAIRSRAALENFGFLRTPVLDPEPDTPDKTAIAFSIRSSFLTRLFRCLSKSAMTLLNFIVYL
jgi:hypothetical protein